MHKKRKGTFSKSGVGSTQLNDLMLRYCQDNQVSNALGCIIKGANIDYKDGAALLIAIYGAQYKLLKALLACEPVRGLEEAVRLAEKADDDRALQLLNEYINKTGLGASAGSIVAKSWKPS